MIRSDFCLIKTSILLLSFLFLMACEQAGPIVEPFEKTKDSIPFKLRKRLPQLSDSVQFVISIDKDVKIIDYFEFIDRQVITYDSLVPYTLTEHLLIKANPWVIDSLAATDYYTQMDRGRFVYDQKQMIILHAGDRLLVPNENWATALITLQKQTSIDVNVPEFAFRILENEKERYKFLIRVGQDRERYLKTAGRIENLRTRRGKGRIVKIKRDPIYMNPVDGHRYESTKRDDGRRTKLPQIPFLHPEINGHRWGQLIHPTTNRETLGKAYSNGCIGTSEGDAWRIYYHAPVGTEILIRYDLEIINKKGDSLLLDDIYQVHL